MGATYSFAVKATDPREENSMAQDTDSNQPRENHGGSNLNRSPIQDRLRDEKIEAQKQEWPGSDQQMQPKPDHGEESYKGSGKLQGKKAIITGADSGIGRAVAIAFAREGADVAIAYYQEDQDAQETLKWVQEAGRKGVLIRADIRKPEECQRLVSEAIEGLGGVNILVNNAGFHEEQKNIENISPEQLEDTYRTNVFSFIWCIQSALPYLHEGDVIINTGSVTGLRGSPDLLDYAGTKAAIHNMTKSLAGKFADRGIRVNCVAPGPVWTPLIPATRYEEKVEGFGSQSMWGRPAHPAELAPSYVFLASTDSRYYTGEILAPTGTKSTTR